MRQRRDTGIRDAFTLSRRVMLGLLIALLWAVGCGGGDVIVLPWRPSAAPVPAADGLRAGFGRADITPPPGVPLAGSGPESQQSSGYRHRLYARALVVEDRRGERIALLVADLPLMPALLHREAADRLHSHGLGADRLIAAATHTHAGPGNFFEAWRYNGDAGGLPGYDPLMVDFLAERIESAIANALSDLRPARVAWGSLEIPGVTRNRSVEAFLRNGSPTLPLPDDVPPLEVLRRRDLSTLDQFTLRKITEAAVDRTWTMLRVDQCAENWSDCRPRGAFSVFAVHPTAYPATNRLLDGDLFAVLERRLEDHIRGDDRYAGSDAFHLVANGAGGDVTAASESTRCERHAEMRPGFEPGGPHRPPSVERWLYLQTTLEDCSERARRAANRTGDRLAESAVALYETLGSEVERSEPKDILIDRAFATVRLDSLYDRPLCLNPTAGFSNAAGSTEDARVRLEGWKVFGLIPTHLEEGGGAVDRARKHCDGAKKRILGGRQVALNGEYGFPKYAQFSVVRIGDLLLATVPGEPTSVSGLRMKLGVAEAFGTSAAGVAIVSHANGYLQYVATPEEYEAQHYEGGSTLYGPNSSAVFTDILSELSRSIASDRPIVRVKPIFGSVGRNRSYMLPATEPPQPMDVRRKIEDGPTCRQNEFTATWIDLEPILLMPSDGRILEIQRRNDADGRWETVAWDDDRSVEVRVKAKSGAHHRLWEVRWVPDAGAAGNYAPYIPPGTYRLRLPARPYMSGELKKLKSPPVAC